MTDVAKSFTRILWIGLVAGTLDITENIVFNALRRITPMANLSVHRYRTDRWSLVSTRAGRRSVSVS